MERCLGHRENMHTLERPSGSLEARTVRCEAVVLTTGPHCTKRDPCESHITHLE